MHFDGACTKERAGAGVILISPKGMTFKYSFTLAFKCINNIAEYEAVLLGLKLANKHGIRQFRIVGDSELIFFQVRSIYQSKNKRLK